MNKNIVAQILKIYAIVNAVVFRLHGVGRQGQTHQFGIHFDDRRPVETADAVRGVKVVD